jgi:hypothetical protein
MAKFVLKNAFLSIDGNDVSDHVESLTINYSAETPEKTAMGDNSLTRLPGLKDSSVDANFRQDFAAGNVDAILFPLVGAAAFPVIIRPDAGAKGAANPEFTGNFLLASYNPLGGSVGDVAAAPVTMVADGDLARGV